MSYHELISHGMIQEHEAVLRWVYVASYNCFKRKRNFKVWPVFSVFAICQTSKTENCTGIVILPPLSVVNPVGNECNFERRTETQNFGKTKSHAFLSFADSLNFLN